MGFEGYLFEMTPEIILFCPFSWFVRIVGICYWLELCPFSMWWLLSNLRLDDTFIRWLPPLKLFEGTVYNDWFTILLPFNPSSLELAWAAELLFFSKLVLNSSILFKLPVILVYFSRLLGLLNGYESLFEPLFSFNGRFDAQSIVFSYAGPPNAFLG